MRTRPWLVCLCGLALATPVVAAAPAAQPSTPAVTEVDPPFDARVAAAKASMLADTEHALALARQAFAIAAARPPGRQRRLEEATAQWLMGESLNRLNRPNEAAAPIAAALAAVEQEAPGSKLHGDILMSRSQIAFGTGQAQRALEDLQRAYRFFVALGERRSQSVALQNIGSLYNLAEDQERVLRYYRESAEAYSGDPNLSLAAHNNNGIALRRLGRFAEAETEFRKALALAREMKSPALEARVLNNLAFAQLLAGHIARADATATAGLRIAAANDEAREWRPFLWGVQAEVAFRRGNFAQAAALLDRTFDGVDPTKTTPLYREFHDTAQRLYSAIGDDRRAFVHLAALKRLDDETREVRASTNAALMAARFDFSNQELQISRLKTGQLERDVLLARSKARLQTIVIAATLLLLALVLAAYFSIRRSRNQTRSANRDLSSANAALEKALKAKSEFLATTSHEIRTPLNGILGMTQVLLRDPKLASDARDRVQVVQGAGEMMKAVVDDILDMAKIETGRIEIEREEIELRSLLRDVAGLWTDQAATKGVQVSLDIDRAPDRVIEDSRRLRQVVFNLMSNAVKFTERGSVTLLAEARPSPDGETLAIVVRDTGIGISPDHLDMIFEPFRQVDAGTSRKFSGTGLGLAISRNLVEAMGGTLTVESAPDRGSTFIVTLPLHRAAGRDEDPAEPGAAPPAQLADARVLIVEPNPLFQSIVRAALEGEAKEVELVHDQNAATDALAGRCFDVVAIAAPADLATLAPLRDALGDGRLVLLCEDLGSVDRAAAQAAGVDLCARRSFPPIDLAAILDQSLHVESAADAPATVRIAA